MNNKRNCEVIFLSINLIFFLICMKIIKNISRKETYDKKYGRFANSFVPSGF